MSRLTERPTEAVCIDGVEYRLNTHYVNCLLTWEAFEAYSLGEITPFALADVAIQNMYHEPRPEMSEEALRRLSEYLNKYSRTSDNPHDDGRPPLIDLEQDANFIFDAFMQAGVDLDTQSVSYPRFMSMLRELPENCQLCRIIYLRQRRRDNKLTKEERQEVERRGLDVINIRDRRAEKQYLDYENELDELKARVRKEQGLEPL
jgi:hypothetical protein